MSRQKWNDRFWVRRPSENSFQRRSYRTTPSKTPDLLLAKLELEKDWGHNSIVSSKRKNFRKQAPNSSRVNSLYQQRTITAKSSGSLMQTAQKAVQLREESIQKILELDSYLSKLSEIEDLDLIKEECLNLLDAHRKITLSVVESIARWREQLNFLSSRPEPVPFLVGNQNYLLKMKSDLKLTDTCIGSLIGFRDEDPLFIGLIKNSEISSNKDFFNRLMKAQSLIDREGTDKKAMMRSVSRPISKNAKINRKIFNKTSSRQSNTIFVIGTEQQLPLYLKKIIGEMPSEISFLSVLDDLVEDLAESESSEIAHEFTKYYLENMILDDFYEDLNIKNLVWEVYNEMRNDMIREQNNLFVRNIVYGLLIHSVCKETAEEVIDEIVQSQNEVFEKKWVLDTSRDLMNRLIDEEIFKAAEQIASEEHKTQTIENNDKFEKIMVNNISKKIKDSLTELALLDLLGEITREVYQEKQEIYHGKVRDLASKDILNAMVEEIVFQECSMVSEQEISEIANSREKQLFAMTKDISTNEIFNEIITEVVFQISKEVSEQEISIQLKQNKQNFEQSSKGIISEEIFKELFEQLLHTTSAEVSEHEISHQLELKNQEIQTITKNTEEILDTLLEEIIHQESKETAHEIFKSIAIEEMLETLMEEMFESLIEETIDQTNRELFNNETQDKEQDLAQSIEETYLQLIDQIFNDFIQDSIDDFSSEMSETRAKALQDHQLSEMFYRNVLESIIIENDLESLCNSILVSQIEIEKEKGRAEESEKLEKELRITNQSKIIYEDILSDFLCRNWLPELVQHVIELEISQSNNIFMDPEDYAVEMFTPGIHSPAVYTITNSEDQRSVNLSTKTYLESIELDFLSAIDIQNLDSLEFQPFSLEESQLIYIMQDFYYFIPEVYSEIMPSPRKLVEEARKGTNTGWYWAYINQSIVGLLVVTENNAYEIIHVSCTSFEFYLEFIEKACEFLWKLDLFNEIRIKFRNSDDVTTDIKQQLMKLQFRWKTSDQEYTVLGMKKPGLETSYERDLIEHQRVDSFIQTESRQPPIESRESSNPV